MTTKAKVFHFDSPSAFAEAADAMSSYAKRCDSSWTGETWEQAVASARTGHTNHVAKAEALLDKVLVSVDAPRTEWRASVAGATPIVPAFVAGLPETMRRRVSTTDDRSPIRFYVDLTSSGGVPVSDLTKRGIAYLALAMALSNERPIEVYGVIVLGRYQPAIVTYRIGAAPLDLATACNALSSTGLVRGIGYSFLRANGASDGGWGWNITPDDEKSRAFYVAKLREALGAGENDIVAAPAFRTDEAIANPVEFVRRSLDEHNAKHKEEV